MNKYYTGSLFFSFDENNVPVYFRLIKGNGEYFTMMNLSTKEITKKKKSEWESMLGFIKPDAIVSASVVETPGNSEDVIVTVFKLKDMITPSTDSHIPYAVCRQNIKDIFSEMYDATKEYYGCSISKDTCPTTPTFSYQDFLSCTSIKTQANVAIYLEDTIDDILSRFPGRFVKEADRTLELNYEKHAANSASRSSGEYGRMIYKNIMAAESDLGYVKTLSALLKSNGFIDDVYKGLGILPVVFDFEGVESNTLTKEQCEGLSKHIRQNIVSGAYIKYTHEIHLDEQKDWLLLLDKNNILYFALLKIKGGYHIPIEDTETPENVGKLSVIMPTKSTIEAARILRASNDGDKYK